MIDYQSDLKWKINMVGPTMDKLADAFMESMGKQWQAMIQKTSANQEFQERLIKILGEASQQQRH